MFHGQTFVDQGCVGLRKDVDEPERQKAPVIGDEGLMGIRSGVALMRIARVIRTIISVSEIVTASVWTTP
jgi:hypothetical protein